MSLLLLLLFNLVIHDINGAEQFIGPSNPSAWKSWLDGLKDWRTQIRKQIHYNDSVYRLSDLKWTQTSYIQPQSHPYDRYFYDVETHSYTISKFVNDLKNRYGGIDSVLVWPTYTNIGIDDRNQYDLIRSMPPGGIEGLRKMVHDFHSHGVRVLWPYNPWDQGTRYEGVSDEDALASLIKATTSDGFNGDTMGSIPKEFWQAGLNTGIHIAMEPEGGGNADTINYDTMGWGYWNYPYIPSVDAWKWLVPAHMTNVCDRWNKDKTNNLQAAWFNGEGYESWENVWGTWNGITPRDGEAIRRVGSMLRYLGSLGLLISEDWEPHTPVLQTNNGIFASKWSVGKNIAWTFVNRDSKKNTKGAQLSFISPGAEYTYYDCYHGVQFQEITNAISPQVTLSFDIEASGYGCVLAASSPPSNLTDFLDSMKLMTKLPLSAYDNTWKYLHQTMVHIPRTPTQHTPPPGMVKIPKANYHYISNGVEIEGDDEHGVDVQYPWENHPQKEHDHVLNIDAFFIDKYPVTNSDYAKYLKNSGYKPTQTWNFLKHWNNSGTYPNGWDKKPVVWVSLEEARKYCSAAKKRLPHSYEWQYAAQGTTGHKYPWGSQKTQANYPKHTTGRVLGPPSDVDAHPNGASPFGVEDMVGNVWQMTDEFHDNHTRALIVKGSSYYRPSGSMWYFPEAMEVNKHNKYFLMDDSYDRAGTLGFRCVVDIDNGCTQPICGQVNGKVNDPGAVVDLTKEGSIDWTHYGRQSVGDVNRKVKGNIIGNLTSSAPSFRYEDSPLWYFWSDGAHVPTETGTTTGVYVPGSGDSFTLTVPAGTKRQILRIYVGVWQSSMKITATLSDGSPIFTDSSLKGTQNAVVELNFQTNTDHQSLTIRITGGSDDGNITFQSAALALASSNK